MLCQKCDVLCTSIDQLQDIYPPHGDTIQDLHVGAESGCWLCGLMIRACHESAAKFSTQAIDSRRGFLDYINGSHGMKLKLVKDRGIEILLTAHAQGITKPSPGDTQSYVHYVFFGRYDLPDRLESSLFPRDPNNLNTGSETALALVSSWLEECLANHHTCNDCANAEQQLPHRVIDVGLTSGSAEPYLLETSGQSGKYITLSHCWGEDNHPVITTNENIRRHKMEIKFADLPRTFQDAVYVSRKIGCRYLWIDSLCIIQNSKEDWEVEAAMMGQYYGQSMLTIAAADGENSAAGLFRERDGPRHLPYVLPSVNGRANWPKLYAFTREMSFDLKITGQSVKSTPGRLYSRAWVFQEQALSPRTLTFARDHVSWRCQETVFNERAPLVKPIKNSLEEDSSIIIIGPDTRQIDAAIMRLQREWILVGPKYAQTQRLKKSDSTRCYLPEDEFLISWGNVVLSYNERQMTYDSDKLAAIQGIATTLEASASKKYFAGSWVDSTRSIAMSMLWSSQVAGSKRLDIAPSWSWASTISKVQWPGHLLRHLVPRIEVKELKSHAGPSEPLPKLVIQANTRPAIMNQRQLSAILDSSDMQSKSGPDPSRYQQPREVPKMIFLDDNLGSSELVWLVELAVGETYIKESENQVHCVILVNWGDNEYRRVGYCIWEEPVWASSNLPQLMRRVMTLV
ncbi:heterokaryon incompatibility protein-domain-containing protein [Xylaria palmicola]|nr:heterokaryon incompatibility protein-domain-containing protein [Xylaria palmicola]